METEAPPGGRMGAGGNLVGGSSISLRRLCHRHKHTIRHPGTSAAAERWSVGEGDGGNGGVALLATGANTHCSPTRCLIARQIARSRGSDISSRWRSRTAIVELRP